MGVMKLDESLISININTEGHTRRIERKLGSSITPVILVYGGRRRCQFERVGMIGTCVSLQRSQSSNIGILLFFLRRP